MKKTIIPIACIAILLIAVALGISIKYPKHPQKDDGKEIQMASTTTQEHSKQGYYVVKRSESYLLYKNEKMQRTFSGLKKIVIPEVSEKSDYYYFSNGVWDQSVKGLLENGEEIVYVRKGQIDRDFSGTLEQKGFQWTVTEGIVTGGPNGTTKSGDTVYKVKDGNIIGIN